MNASGDRYLKMNGCGNSIIVLDWRGGHRAFTAEIVRAIVASGVHFDQLMLVDDARRAGTAAFMQIFNRDGSEAEACGNGTRCVAWALSRKPGSPARMRLETRVGVLDCERQGPESFTVDMGVPRLLWDEIPLAEAFADTRTIELQIGPIDAPVLHTPSAVNMGNPHVIVWVEDVASYDLARFGPMLENHPMLPERANISLAQVKAPDHLVIRVWERGAGLTLACGTAACAAAVAAVRKGYCGRSVRVSLPGGDLTVAWRESDGHVLMTGPVALEYEGHFAPELLEATA